MGNVSNYKHGYLLGYCHPWHYQSVCKFRAEMDAMGCTSVGCVTVAMSGRLMRHPCPFRK